MRTTIRAVLAATVVTTVTITSSPVFAQPASKSDHMVAVRPAPTGSIDGSYIVQLKPGADVKAIMDALKITPRYEYIAAVTGFAADLTDSQLVDLRRRAEVLAISEDATMTRALDDTQLNPPSWGIDRVDQRTLPLSASFTYSSLGKGVHAYVIDTGIDVTHPDFGGRASFDVNTIDTLDYDCHGHGTHVAGTLGSQTYGVAKMVTLHAVKALDCTGDGRTAALIKAVDWVTAHAIKPAVANASWYWDADPTLEAALRAMIDSGVFLSASAGNTGNNSCDLLPRKIETALVIAASDQTDNRWPGSSVGPCVDLYAPGVAIRSTWPGSAALTLTGTSMATPHVAGAAAQLLQDRPTATPAWISAHLEATSSPDVIAGGATGDTPNRLLFTDH